MVEKNGKAPANARVDINYSGKTPKIKFSYPKTGKSPEKQAFRQNLFGLHWYIILIIMLGFFYAPMYMQTKTVNYPSECNVTLDKYFYNKHVDLETSIKNYSYNINRSYVYGANITCDNKTYKIKFNTKELIGERYIGFYNDDNNLNKSLYLSLYRLIIIIVGMLSCIFSTKYLIKQKWYQKWYPKHSAEGFFAKSKKYIKFTNKDIENNMVEIPLFSNVELDYKTNGDFSNKLERIKIREHQYNKYRKGKVGKKVVKEYKWYARFYFKDKPKNGYLEVIFQ